MKGLVNMRKCGIFSRIVSVALIFAVAATMLILTSCTAATTQVTLSFENASGKGTLVSTVIVPTNTSDNTGTYVKNVQKMAEHLQSKVDRLTSTQGIYTIAYGGQVSGGEAITMTYTFDDINDYNKKTMRLFFAVPRSVRNGLGTLGDEYKFASWTQNGENITFSQSGDIFTAINLWAYNYLLNNDIEDAWDNTGDGQKVQLSYFGAATDATIVRATENVTVNFGLSSQNVKAFSGESVQTVSVTGKLDGTFVSVDTTVTDESIYFEHPAEEEVSSQPEEKAEDADKLSPLFPVSTAVIAVFAVTAIVIALKEKKKEGENNA